MPDLVAVFLIGFLGSAHCVGMCGGFPLLLTQRPGTAGSPVMHQVVYFIGKTLTYTVLGILVGAFGGYVAHGMAVWQNALGIVLGLFLVWIGLGLVGLLQRFAGPAGLGRWSGLSSGLSFFLRRGGYSGTLGVGLVNGLLPCALVYAMLAEAATAGSWYGGALTMAVFGLSTIPALALVAYVGTVAQPVWRARLNLASGILVILLGLVTIARAVPGLPFHNNHAPDANGSMAPTHQSEAPSHH